MIFSNQIHSPFFTILTASLNRASTLRSTLESVRRQSLLPHKIEHVVIDGNSTDDTVDILRAYEKQYHLHWISEPDRGIAEALNKGLRMAQGRYVLVLQADDHLLDRDTLERVFSVVSREIFDIHSFPIFMDHQIRGQVLRNPIPHLFWNRFKFILPHQGVFVHRRVFDRIGEFNEHYSIAMDYDFFYRALTQKSTIRFEKFPVALMGGEGIGSRRDLLSKRLQEEALVQRRHEQNPLWRLAQVAFWLLYRPYKIHSH